MFYGCSSMTSVVIGDGVTTIDYDAFRSCTNLVKVVIPGGVTSIGNSAFRDCDSLAYVYYMGTETEWDQITIGAYNTELTNATIHYNS